MRSPFPAGEGQDATTPNISHRITSVGGRLRLFRDTTFRERQTRERSAPRTNSLLCAERPTGYLFKYTERGLRIRASKARMPKNFFGKIHKRPFPAGKGLLWLFLLVSFLVRRQEKYTPKRIDIAATKSQPYQTKTNLPQNYPQTLWRAHRISHYKDAQHAP